MQLPTSMTAMVLPEWDAPFVRETRPVPTPAAGEVLVRVVACGAGLTLLHIRAGRMGGRTPVVMGHEFGGVIAAVGSGVQHWRPGQRVAATFNLVCGFCTWCASGRETLCENFAGFLGAAADGAFAE